MSRRPLPELFLKNMELMFREYNHYNEFEDFIQSFDKIPHRGIRMNRQKTGGQDESYTVLRQMFAESGMSDSSLEPILWSDDGYYIPENFFPGRHLFYPAGLFYIQEPSAMLPANVLKASPGEHILDLCAAPGGKSVKIAADMKGGGILVCNDINESRVKALVRNVELAGCTNCIVLNDTPKNIAEKLPGYFDKILLDAPCSGEGMFRRDPDAVLSWEDFGNQSCVTMQKEILIYIDRLLKEDGILVYSTCTFSTRENEEMMQWFIQEHPWYEIVPIVMEGGVDKGFSHCESIQGTARIFPHHARGEGHYCAKLKKNRNRYENKNIENGENINNGENIYNNENNQNNQILEGYENSEKHELNKKHEKYYNSAKHDLNEKNVKHEKYDKNLKYENRNTDSTDYNKRKQNCRGIDPTTTKNKLDIRETRRNAQAYSGMNSVLSNRNEKQIRDRDKDEISESEFYEAFQLFSKDVLTTACILRIVANCNNYLQIVKGHVYTLPEPAPNLDGLKIAKKGWYLGEVKATKSIPVFEPSHSFLLSLCKEDLIHPLSFALEDPLLLKYLKGETIFHPHITNGYIPICIQGFPLGWGKGMPGDMIKNMYPQGWRK